MGLGKWEKMIPDDPIQRPFGEFSRGADGKLNDEELVKCLTESIEDLAGAFGANNVPQCLKVGNPHSYTRNTLELYPDFSLASGNPRYHPGP